MEIGKAYKRILDNKILYIVGFKETGESNIILSEQKPENFKAFDHYSFTVTKATLEECYREHTELPKQADLFTS